MNVVALHRPAKVSGVSTAGLSAARLEAPHTPARPLIIGEALTDTDVAQSPLAGAPGVALCTWPKGADAVDQVLAVRDALRSLNVDVVLTNDLPHAFAAASLEHYRGTRCAAWLHSASHDGEALVTTCFELADAWRAVSHEGRRRALTVAAELGLELPPPRATAPAFIDVPGEPAPLPPLGGDHPLRLLYAARLEKHHKRVLDLAHLCDALAARAVHFHLTIAGEGPAERELRAALAPHSPRVTFTGAVPPARMSHLLHEHHLLLLVSASEAAPMCVMEAMAAARPAAITTSCGEATHWIRSHSDGLIIPTGDMPALAAALSTLVNSPGALHAMSSAAHARALQLFSPAARAPALNALFNEAAACPGDHATPDAITRRWTRTLHALSAIGPFAPERAAHLANLWLTELRAVGIDTAEVDLPLSVTPRPSPGERRLRRTLAHLRQQGRTRLALYGCGRHTAALASAIASTPELVAIIDDAAGTPHGPPPHIAGKPVLSPAHFPLLDAHALIISSDEHEREMLTRARTFADHVVPLYEAA
ncbi:MAG TPA: glycosyltransferase [Phycisphaerales bacterium]|nr:glycosyltransferase [Phycisphaerales bacterium]